jgi:alpha-beta hydrolase superfamily lysophospholipase
MVSLRAHGDSTGDVNDVGYSARHDVIAAIEFLQRRRPGRPVVVLGVSMGAAAAVFASGELEHRVQGYILESPYQDLKIAVRNRVEGQLPPLLGGVAYQGLVLVAPLVLPELEKMSPLAAIDGIPADVPVLILAGGRDRLARPEEAQALLGRVSSHGRMLLFKDATHNNLFASDRKRYRDAMTGLVEDVDVGWSKRGSRPGIKHASRRPTDSGE